MGRQDLIDELQRFAADLGTSPTTHDMHEQGKYAAQAYYYYFDTWDDALDAAGLESTSITRADLIEDLRSMRETVGNPSSWTETIREHGTYSLTRFYTEFGGIDDALDAADIEQDDPPRISKEDIIEEISRLAKQETPPSVDRMDSDGRFSARICWNRFGSWNAAVRAAGYEPLRESETHTEEELLADIKRLHDELGRPPTTRDMVEQGTYTASVYFSRFESWNTAVREAGFTPNDRFRDPAEQRIPAADLLAELERVAEFVGGRPTIEDMVEHGNYSAKPYTNRFGSWNKALEHAGFTPFTGTSEDLFSRDELIDELQRLAQEVDRPPTTQQMEEQGRYSTSPFQNLFGSWIDALKDAGLEPTEHQLRKYDP